MKAEVRHQDFQQQRLFYYCYFLSDFHCVFIKTDKLKELCRKFVKTNRDVKGGDSNTSKGILLPITIFFENIY